MGGEFRVLCAYICLYARMYDAFQLIQVSKKKPKSTIHLTETQQQDRRIEWSEFQENWKRVQDHGFFFLKTLTEDRVEEVFNAMDVDKQGLVLLEEWCEYIKWSEQEAGTPLGRILSVGDDEE